jgi:hypothetical protein
MTNLYTTSLIYSFSKHILLHRCLHSYESFKTGHCQRYDERRTQNLDKGIDLSTVES